MNDPKILEARRSGRGVIAKVQLTIRIDGGSMVVGDNPMTPVGDACAAIHEQLVAAMGPVNVVESRSTKDYSERPTDDPKLRIQEFEGVSSFDP